MRPLLLTAALLAALAPAAEAKLFDVNNDLRQDLVVGLPGWQTKDGAELGAIYVRGAKRGLLGRVSLLTRKELGVPEGGSNAMIGASVTSADFDGDDFEDLAFGAPFLGSVGGRSSRTPAASWSRTGPRASHRSRAPRSCASRRARAGRATATR